MAKAACTDQEFIDLWKVHQSPAALARVLKVDVRNIQNRRRNLEARMGIELPVFRPIDFQMTIPENKIRRTATLEEGTVIVFSDAHYWPGIISTAHRALLVAIKELQPKCIILNGDAFDGAAPGRHGRIMWEAKPNVKQELEAVSDRTGEIEQVARNAQLVWNWGNHCQRFNSKLSAMVPEFEGVHGFALEDHFPAWDFGMSLMINDDVMVKHRWHNGVHATWNNVLKSGTSMVTGHLHALGVRPYTDYRGTRYAVDTGTLAAVDGPQFSYSEDTPANHRAGFAVLTFYQGKLMPPELLEVIDEDARVAYFRGQVIQV